LSIIGPRPVLTITTPGLARRNSAGLGEDGVDANTIHYRELVVTGTTACSTSDCRTAAEVVRDGRLDLAPFISRRITLADLPLDFVSPIDKAKIKTVLVTADRDRIT
jgi:threonine dehydrogenase-like Zn-dependent dehydrogenase